MRKCAICDSTNFKEVLGFDKFIFSDGSKINYPLIKEECQFCGTIRTKLQIKLEDFYKNSYKPSRSMDTIALMNNENVQRSQFIYKWVTDLIPENILNNFDSMLEIGCGQGYLLEKFNVPCKYGIEPNREASKIASNKIVNIRNIGYEDIGYCEKYDFVLSYCVVEHVENPKEFLQKSFSVLNGGGLCA